LVELHHRIMDRVRQELETFEERVAQRGVDERSIRALVRAFVGQEFARLHGIVREELDKVRTEVEEKLNRLGLDAEAVRRLVDEVYNKLLGDLSGIIDRRIMHVLSVIDEQNSSIKDILDLVNALLESEVKSEEILEKLRSELSEERLEELLYRVLVKRGIIRRKRRKWVLPIIGLSILGAVVAGFVINPAITAVIILIAIVVLLRW